jgi:hypothetical protein
MFLIYPSILLPAPNIEVDPQIRTLVGTEDQLSEWPSAILEPGACNDTSKTIEVILANNAGERVVPLVEKVLLASAIAGTKLGLKNSISLEAARNCTDRLRQRQALEKTGLNPRWSVDGVGDLKYPLIIKKPASARSSGVMLIKNKAGLTIFLKDKELNAQEQRLHDVGFPPAHQFIVEEYIEGDSWEVSGISRDKVVHTFPPIRQIWDPPTKWIDEYRLEAPPAGLIEAAVDAVEACGLKWAPWCVELKGTADNWKIIEVNGRLGEDGRGYYKKLGGNEVANKLCELLT